LRSCYLVPVLLERAGTALRGDGQKLTMDGGAAVASGIAREDVVALQEDLAIYNHLYSRVAPGPPPRILPVHLAADLIGGPLLQGTQVGWKGITCTFSRATTQEIADALAAGAAISFVAAIIAAVVPPCQAVFVPAAIATAICILGSAACELAAAKGYALKVTFDWWALNVAVPSFVPADD
jgi:hypothetical protein